MGLVWLKSRWVNAAASALTRAVELGQAKAHCLRLARCFAAVLDDQDWYAESSAQLLDVVDSTDEKRNLLLENALTHMRGGHRKAASEALRDHLSIAFKTRLLIDSGKFDEV